MKECKPDFNFAHISMMALVVSLIDNEPKIMETWRGTNAEWVIRFYAFAKRYMKLRKFDPKWKPVIEKINKDPTYIEAQNQEISTAMTAVMLIKYYVESVPKKHQPEWGISRKYLTSGLKNIAFGMLLIKKTDRELYEEKKQLVKSSSYAAECLYGAINRHILCAEYPIKED